VDNPSWCCVLKPAAASLGFNQQTLASQIGYSFGGAEVQKIQRDGNELRVVVHNISTARVMTDDLLHTRVLSSKGDWVLLQSIATISAGYVSGALYREAGKTVNTISASIERKRVAPEEVSQAVFEQLVPDLVQKYPGIQVKKAGELEEMGEIAEGMKRALLLAAVLIYILMAVPLKSYWQPLVILSIIPFGFVGAVLGHMMMGLSLSLMSFFGMLSLTGVVINDSLVLVTRYNQLRESGMSIAFGELFSTALLLILVPVLLTISDDVKRLICRQHQASPEPHTIKSIDNY
jgi:multidrug efflux pump subunit AcrB